MTRIGIMTFLHNDNYGSILQAWALEQALADLHFEAEHIDYNPSKWEKVRNLILSGNSPRLILEGMRKRSAGRGMDGAFGDFRARKLRLSPNCPSRGALRRQAKGYDVLLCGSDQIWSPTWLNPAYFLNFTDKPKVAYAPSLGVSAVPPGRKAAQMARWTRPFSALSVREQEGAEILHTLTGRHAAVMPDPVMLVEPEKWRELMAGEIPHEPYLLCFFLGDRAEYWEKVRALSGKTGLPILVIPRTEGAFQSGCALETSVPVQRWLHLIDGAAHVMTDSFHASAFALILHTPLTILRRYHEDDPESKNSRIDQLLRVLNVQDTAAPDWEQVDRSLCHVRRMGRLWLGTALIEAVNGGHPAGET